MLKLALATLVGVPLLTTGGEAWNATGVLSVVADVTAKVATPAR